LDESTYATISISKQSDVSLMKKCIYIIACEPSGDVIGASLMRAIMRASSEVQICGVGGPLMEAACTFKSLFDISRTSVMGLAEVLPHIISIKKLIDMTVEDIVKKKPCIIITIDSPGFCFRVVRKLRQKRIQQKIIHYVAPSVWAWRPQRAAQVAALFDHLFTLFDFEPPYFTKEGLDTTFVGHPATETFFSVDTQKRDVLLILPGSRKQEVKRLLPIFMEATSQQDNKIVIPTIPNLVTLIRSIVGNSATITTDDKVKLFQTAKKAITASGTATLELALSGCPMVVAYKMSCITFSVLKRLVRTKFISLPNIITNKSLVPELVQSSCSARAITAALQTVDSQDFCCLKKHTIPNPSTTAANIILNF
jgi:lipid-A-disaccharide synthase